MYLPERGLKMTHTPTHLTPTRNPFLTAITSPAVIGGALSLVAGIYGLPTGDQLTSAAAALGGLLSIVGRVLAKQKIL
jgi:hypothetical protein